LYSGEQFDSKINQQYLRQRYYDPSTGRFNRLDPFFGNLNDPLSLHKYLYTHGDPVNGIDSNGMFMCTVGIIGAFALSSTIRARHDGQTISIGSNIIFNLKKLDWIQRIVWGNVAIAALWLDFARPISNIQGELLLGFWVTSFLWNRGHDNTQPAPVVLDGSQDTWLWGTEMSIFGHPRVTTAKDNANLQIRQFFANNPTQNTIQGYVGNISLDAEGFSIRGMGWFNWTVGTGTLDFRAERSTEDRHKAIVTYAYRDKIDALTHDELKDYYQSGNPLLYALALAEGSVSTIPGYYFYVTKMNVEIDLNN
jgi:RHS repeat-associated protein